MKKNKSLKALSFIFCFLMVFFFVGCKNLQATGNTKAEPSKKIEISKENNNLKEEDVLFKINESLKNLKAVSSKYEVNVDEIGLGKKDLYFDGNYDLEKILEESKEILKDKERDKFEIKVLSKILYSKEKDNQGYPKIKAMYDDVKLGNEESRSYVNLEKNKAYTAEGTKEFEEFKGEEIKTQDESSYGNTVKMFLFATTSGRLSKQMGKALSMTEKKETYDFTFKGKNNPDLVFMLDGLFNLAVSDFNLENVNVDVTYKFSKKDFTLQEVEHKLFQEAETEKGRKAFYSRGKYIVKSINDFDKIDEVQNLEK